MCTVSAFYDQSGLVVTMNRDEQRTRHEALPIVSQTMLYPVDEKQGGTWMGGNHNQVIMCLLNLYEHEYFVGEQSRGNIIPELLELKSFDAITVFLQSQFDPYLYSAFSLLTFYKNQVFKSKWDGISFTHELSNLDPWYFFTSSGLDSLNVQSGRHILFDQYKTKGADFKQASKPTSIPSIHLTYVKGNETQSCFVQRLKVHTKSICQYYADEKTIKFHYYPENLIVEYINNPTINPSLSKVFFLE
ncbi:NRDE family protein [Marinicellulosiphila megalodicopiae]|uniref:NRDE family protein n=1 Tax=Marinicellulosiphila megalodicopiae TaxID=2724896 RepID=UPI003BAEA4C7